VTTSSSSREPKLALSVAEACELAGVSRAFMYGQWQMGRGPARLKISKRTLILRKSLESWLASLETASKD